MIKELVERVPLGTKIEYAMRTLGLTSEERTNIDAVISTVGTNPMVATVLGEEVSDLKSGITSVYKLASDNDEQAETGKSIARAVIKTPAARKAAASTIMKWILAQENPTSLLTSLQKVSELPIPGFADVEHSDPEAFIRDGALPFIGTLLGTEEEDLLGFPCSCPYCKQSFITQIN